MAHVYRYQQLVRERSLRFNFWLFIKYMRFHWFRIASACVVMVLFLLARYIYTERVFVRTVVVTIGVNILRILYISTTVLLISLGLWYYIRYRSIKSRVVAFLSQASKRRLEQLYRRDGAKEYPVEFMQEELVELVSAALLHATQQTALSSPSPSPYSSTINATVTSTSAGAASNSTPSSSSSSVVRQFTPVASSSQHPALTTPTTQSQRTWLGWVLGYKPAIKMRYSAMDVEMLALPHDLVSDIKPNMVRKYWKDVQQAVEKGMLLPLLS